MRLSMVTRGLARRLVLVSALGLVLPVSSAAQDAACEGPPRETNGRRLLALMVGVGQYKSPSIPRLRGPRNDVEALRRVLVDRYGFPASNVCVLVDDTATTANFEKAFRSALVNRARPGDVALFYFSGHGSQMKDDNGDEPSGMDQTLLFQDARTGGVTDERDDRINQLLTDLYARTEHVVVIVDACNSGSITRAIPPDGSADVVARVVPPAELATPANGILPGPGQSWIPRGLPGLIALTAAGYFFPNNYSPGFPALSGIGLLVLTLETHAWLYLRRPEARQLYL